MNIHHSATEHRTCDADFLHQCARLQGVGRALPQQPEVRQYHGEAQLEGAQHHAHLAGLVPQPRL